MAVSEGGDEQRSNGYWNNWRPNYSSRESLFFSWIGLEIRSKRVQKRPSKRALFIKRGNKEGFTRNVGGPGGVILENYTPRTPLGLLKIREIAIEMGLSDRKYERFGGG